MSGCILEPADTVRINSDKTREGDIVSDAKRVYNTLGGKRVCKKNQGASTGKRKVVLITRRQADFCLEVGIYTLPPGFRASSA